MPVAEAHGVGVLNASPLAMGLLRTRARRRGTRRRREIKDACRRAAELCRDRGADIAFLGMQFCFAEERIPSTITGTARKEELDVNLRAMTEPIDRQLLAEVEEMLAPVKDRDVAERELEGLG